MKIALLIFSQVLICMTVGAKSFVGPTQAGKNNRTPQGDSSPGDSSTVVNALGGTTPFFMKSLFEVLKTLREQITVISMEFVKN